MNKFYIDVAYLCSVAEIKEYPIQQREDESEEDFLIRKLKSGSIAARSYGTADHPEFAQLREMLGAAGYIHIQRGWWNGDRVLKTFYLNDVRFRRGDEFSCAPAMHFKLTHR